MSKTNIPKKVQIQLWTLSAGRCQFRNCNIVLWRNELTMAKMNKAYIAHIVADQPGGPRGDEIRSPKLAKDIKNLMLLCDECHRTIDNLENLETYTEELLLEMKSDHETRIELLTSLIESNRTNVVLYGANIGLQTSPLVFETCVTALLPNKYPSGNYPIKLGIEGSLKKDSGSEYWKLELDNLVDQFHHKVKPIIEQNSIKSFSLFALAPQPLLIKLGTLFTDLLDVSVFQLHREPATWKWKENEEFQNFELIPPSNFMEDPILNISLSSRIENSRIESIVGVGKSIWTLTHPTPNKDLMKTIKHGVAFRIICRKMFDEIKFKHGQDKTLKVFPTMPISCAIELGRTWMPKADLNMIIYDHDGETNTFKKAIEIKKNDNN